MRRPRRLFVLALLASSAWAPLATCAEAPSLSVLDAVEAALRSSPAVEIQRTEVQLAGGRALETLGALDPVISGRLSIERLNEELTNSARAAEVTRREQIQTTIDTLESERINADAALANALEVAADPANFRFTDPDDQARLDLLNTLLAGTDSPVTRAEIEALREDAIQQQVTAAQRRATDAAAQEARERERLARLGEVPDAEVSHDVSANLELRRAFRSGDTAAAYANLSMFGFNKDGKPRDSEDGGSGVLDLYRSRIGFRFNLPLGAGRGAPGSEIDAAAAEQRAAESALLYQLSAVVADVVDRYWLLVALQSREAVLMDSLERQRQLATLTAALIRADLLPGSEATLSDASLAQAEAAQLAAQRSRAVGQAALAAAIGHDAALALPLAADALPLELRVSHLDAVQEPALWAAVAAERADVQSALSQRAAASLRLGQAESDRRSRNDLGIDAFATGVDEGSRVLEQLRGSLLGRWTGPSISLNWSYERPIGLRAAGGRVQQQQAREAQSALQLRESERGVARQLQQLGQQLGLSLQEFELRQRAVDGWNRSVDGERQRLSGGAGTVIDLLLTEERRTAAVLEAINAQYRAASGLVALRHAAGALLQFDAEGGASIRAVDLLVLDASLLDASLAGAAEKSVAAPAAR
jgi:outer membrane protein TolC